MFNCESPWNFFLSFWKLKVSNLHRPFLNKNAAVGVLLEDHSAGTSDIVHVSEFVVVMLLAGREERVRDGKGERKSVHLCQLTTA